MRDTSRRSSTIFCCSRALRSIVSSAFARRASSICVLRSSDVHPSTALSGVRSSCDTVARNSSFSRFAISAVSRAFCTASNSRALSMAIAACAASPAMMRSSLFGEHAGLGVAEKQPAEHLARSGRSREPRDSCAPAGARAACRDAARSGRTRESCVTSARRMIPFAAKSRAEQRRRARDRKSLEMPAIDARQRVEHVRAAAGVEDVVEERAELRANQTRSPRRSSACTSFFRSSSAESTRPKLLMICSASACSRWSFFVRIVCGDVLHDAEHPDDSAVFTVGRVTARGHPPFALARHECGIRCRSRDRLAMAVSTATRARSRSSGCRRARRSVQVIAAPGAHVEDVRGAGREGDHVGDSVPAPVAEPRCVERKAQPFGVGERRRRRVGMIDHRGEPTWILLAGWAGDVTPAVLRERARVPDAAFRGRSAW